MSLKKIGGNESAEQLNVLLVDDDPDIHFLVKEYLHERSDIFVLNAVTSLEAAYQSVQSKLPDIVLLDLSLPESRGLATLDLFREKVKDLPVVILTSLDDEEAALEAVQKGAQDYLVKGHVTPRMLIQVLRYAVERHRTQESKPQQQFLDSITGLYNLQGFLVFSEQHLRTARRNPNGHLIYLLVVKQIKEIEKTHGKGEAHHALKTVAEILKESFRTSDIIARVGDDRFAVFPSISSAFLSEAVIARIKSSQTYYNARFNLYKISLHWKSLHMSSAEPFSATNLSTQMNASFSQFELQQQAPTEPSFTVLG